MAVVQIHRVSRHSDKAIARYKPIIRPVRLVRMLKELSEENKITVLISSHDLNHITDVCHRILLMEKGRIIKDLDTTADTLQELEAYFSV